MSIFVLGITGYADQVVSLLVMPLIAIVIAVNAWRLAALERIDRAPPATAVRLGLGLGVGLLLGRWLSLETSLFPDTGYLQASPLGRAMALVLVLATLGTLYWAIAASRAWLGAAIRKGSLRRPFLVVVIATIGIYVVIAREVVVADD